MAIIGLFSPLTTVIIIVRNVDEEKMAYSHRIYNFIKSSVSLGYHKEIPFTVSRQ